MTVEVRLIGDDGTETVTVDAADAKAVVRPTTAELLGAIARETPESIREAARLVDRDVRQVHDNLWELGQLGLVEFDRGGRAHRPVVEYDRIEVAVDL
jgi:predicted transcriptional regulator